MGALFINRPNGEVTKIDIDGTVYLQSDTPISIDWCDKCQKWQSKEFGRYQEADGIKIMWFCEACK